MIGWPNSEVGRTEQVDFPPGTAIPCFSISIFGHAFHLPDYFLVIGGQSLWSAEIHDILFFLIYFLAHTYLYSTSPFFPPVVFCSPFD